MSRYLGLLEISFVTGRLTPYLRNPAARLIKSPKLFVGDSGLACHLTGATDLDPSGDEPLRGALYETYVHQNLRAILDAHLPDAELGCWSVQGRHEVDFVIARGRRVMAIELKSASRFSKKDLNGLRAFRARATGFVTGILAYNGTEALALGDDLFVIPLGLLLS